MSYPVSEAFGPTYNVNGAALAKHRRKAREGLWLMTRAEIVAYADDVEKVVLAAQRNALKREAPTHSCRCASRTNYDDGADIHRAVQQQQRTALMSYPSKVRKARTDEEWRDMYAKAMTQKRARIAFAANQANAA